MALRRGVDPALLAEVSKPFFYPVWLLWLDWPVAPVRAHTGRGPIRFAGESWAGVGDFASIALPQETAGLAAAQATIRLVAPPAEILAQIDQPIRNRLGGVWFGCVTERAGNTLVGAPVQIFSGYMDAARAPAEETEEGVEHSIEIDLAGGPPARARGSFYHSAADQQREHPGDTAGRLLISNLARAVSMRWPEN